MHTRTLPALLIALAACASKQPVVQPSAATPAEPMSAAPVALAGVPRDDFNRLAAELDLPLFWREDANGDGALDPAELAPLWGRVPAETWLRGGRFTPELQRAFEQIAQRHRQPPASPASLDDGERLRRQKILEELAQGRPTLVETDLSALDAREARFVRDVLAAAKLVESLYARQMGIDGLAAQIPADDPASRAVFHRNQSPRCEAPRTQHDKACSALPNPPAGKLSGLYPAALLAKPRFCEELASTRRDADGPKSRPALTSPFTVVREGPDGALVAVPYTEIWRTEMSQVSGLLAGAADALEGRDEAALVAYLRAASQSFRDNDWAPADEAWSRMSVSNSKWYLRIGPDEVYAEPCNTKALFHVSFGRISQDSLKWQSLLEPAKAEMEGALAELAGPPYAARPVTFHLPDFVEITINAGDSRSASGATIGQSLPNFGAVANEGRGRTVAMTNFYTDADSKASARAVAESLLCPGAMPLYTDDPEPGLMSTVLHEAAHNLGPAHQYRVGGKTAREIFGGPLASTMEELKAQTAALFFADWLAARGQLTAEQAQRAHLRDLLWSFGHISRGMYDDEGHPKAYSQLAAIQLGELMQAGAVTWSAAAVAANGTDRGCFGLQTEKLAPAIRALMKEVAAVKASGDRARAEAFLAKWVDVSGEEKALLDTIAERVLRVPKQSFVYSVRMPE